MDWRFWMRRVDKECKEQCTEDVGDENDEEGKSGGASSVLSQATRVQAFGLRTRVRLSFLAPRSSAVSPPSPAPIVEEKGDAKGARNTGQESLAVAIGCTLHSAQSYQVLTHGGVRGVNDHPRSQCLSLTLSFKWKPRLLGSLCTVVAPLTDLGSNTEKHEIRRCSSLLAVISGLGADDRGRQNEAVVVDEGGGGRMVKRWWKQELLLLSLTRPQTLALRGSVDIFCRD
ncbi:hypothetical protein BDK51DRAFT_44325 [Blyttiomyces helicus]|uniref:Uncharacterized protein n=1 Tax=Blyttiomyces helicus TaxID=388810 RepID=A0A4P9W938_9FUNG|nr:hypothetical protein BDK51DRAFT_44325 [Blyttiomyces helicus]|eukprot:RKO87618.1 hypothetical protein BDK51DRAFT_44325 [Blyttiomyces helicus]